MIEKFIKSKIEKFNGNMAIYYKNLVTNDVFAFNGDKTFTAASMIKVPIMIELFDQIHDGSIDKDEIIFIEQDDKVPSCGALTYMHDNIGVSVEDLCNLMIILSDNTATNVLIKKLGIDNINKFMKKLGINNTVLERKLFDEKAEKEGKINKVTAKEIGNMLDLMWKGKLISPNMSRQMIDILKQQQFNHKIPGKLGENIMIAHKTGDDEGITHDAGIVYARNPFIICALAEKVDVFEANIVISEIAYFIFNENN